MTLPTTLSDSKQAIMQWAAQAEENGLLTTTDIAAIDVIAEQTPAALFDSSNRPLVVAFFGGTGVGKSTLLNRLAGDTIARTGVERPTSREITLYLHDSIEVNHLPTEFPVDKINTVSHHDDNNRHTLWIDMPDFDSAETANRDLVNDWLPHIDLLVYVVSPERYKDDQGWRLLLQHGFRHAWIFVMNHWDRGIEAQREDFTALLKRAGLQQPLLFCTDSSGAAPTGGVDEFAALKTSVQSLADSNTIDQLEARGISIRAHELQTQVSTLLAQLDNPDGLKGLSSEWNTEWQRVAEQITASVAWKIPLIAQPFEASRVSWFRSALGALSGRRHDTDRTPGNIQSIGDVAAVDHTPDRAVTTNAYRPTSPGTTVELLDADALTAINDARQFAVLQAPVHNLPPPLIAKAIEREETRQSNNTIAALNAPINQALQQSLQSPGNAFQRFLHRVFGVLAGLLPVLAMCWAGYRIVMAFYEGGSQPGAYLGGAFAINSLLLIALAWALPFFLQQKVRPSLAKAAERGLKLGLQKTLEGIRSGMTPVWDSVEQTTTNTRTDGQNLIDNLIADTTETADQRQQPKDPALAQVLLNQSD